MEKHFNVIIQGVVALLLCLVISLLFRFMGLPNLEWEIALIIYAIFIIIIPFLRSNNQDFKEHSLFSVFLLLALGIDLIILASLLSWTPIREIPSKASSFLFPLMFFPLVLFFAWLFELYYYQKKEGDEF